MRRLRQKRVAAHGRSYTCRCGRRSGCCLDCSGDMDDAIAQLRIPGALPGSRLLEDPRDIVRTKRRIRCATTTALTRCDRNRAANGCPNTESPGARTSTAHSFTTGGAEEPANTGAATEPDTAQTQTAAPRRANLNERLVRSSKLAATNGPHRTTTATTRRLNRWVRLPPSGPNTSGTSNPRRSPSRGAKRFYRNPDGQHPPQGYRAGQAARYDATATAAATSSTP
jgi:hypothetical protein